MYPRLRSLTLYAAAAAMLAVFNTGACGRVADKYRCAWVRAEMDTYEHEKPGFLFSKTYETRMYPRAADLADFTSRIQATCNEMDADGYEVISIMPVGVGVTEPVLLNKNPNQQITEISHAVTRSAIITARRRD